MSLILVTGRSGSGKSTFAKLLAERLGYKYLDIDKIGHSLYDDKEIMAKAVELFGTVIFDNDGKFNRKKLGKIFFGERDCQRVKEFSALTWDYMEKSIDHYKNENVILDWVLLPTTKYWKEEATKILVLPKNDDERLEKIIKRDNISLEYLKNRGKAGIEYNKDEFDYVIINDYSQDCLTRQVEEIISKLEKEREE